MRKRRTVSPFSLSFLDIMFCGFGAVVLLVLILNTDTVKVRKQYQADLHAEVFRLETSLEDATRDLAVVRNSLAETDNSLAKTQGRSEEVIESLTLSKEELSRYNARTLARVKDVKMLKSDLLDLDKENRRLGAEQQGEAGKGSNVRRFVGDGDRQYLTGLKMGGRRVLILVDVSASMLDETLVNVIRVRNMADQVKRRSAKWKRALSMVEWLAANLPPTSKYQILVFNTRAEPLIPGSGGRWFDAGDRVSMDKAIGLLRRRIPEGGTSLYQAFRAAAGFQSRPDNILLITDGLPTQGGSKPTRSTVSADERLKHFERAVKQLPRGVPVNTMLLPMEGDAMAAAAFWQLAVTSNGSFMTPSRDWP
ncbi:MAG: VWA domain-containing protein [Gammaproteobacteria bacterium]|nr:VWA domain-containing protein [Gammaproteobacteria bacterium]